MCGIFGIANHSDPARMGYVADVYDEDVFAKLKGSNAIGHTRYSTAGESSEGNAQPIVVNTKYGTVALVHNGNLINALSLRESLERQGAIFQSTSDSEVILHLLARSEADNLLDALAETLAKVQGAFSLLLITQDSLIGVRDPNGFRPLNLGKVNGSHVFASETCAFDLIGAGYLREVEPGEIVLIRGEELKSVKALHAPRLAKCIFEHVYFSRPDSIVFGRTVQTSRDLMGRILAEENPVDADLVVPIPDSGVSAAVGYSQQSGMPFAFGLIRNHYVGRKYIEPDSLAYLSLPGLIRAVDGKGNEFCTACYTGQYPLDFADMFPDAKAEDRQLDLWEASLKE